MLDHSHMMYLSDICPCTCMQTMNGEEYNKKNQYINEGTYSIEGKNSINIRRIHKFYILMKSVVNFDNKHGLDEIL